MSARHLLEQKTWWFRVSSKLSRKPKEGLIRNREDQGTQDVIRLFTTASE